MPWHDLVIGIDAHATVVIYRIMRDKRPLREGRTQRHIGHIDAICARHPIDTVFGVDLVDLEARNVIMFALRILFAAIDKKRIAKLFGDDQIATGSTGIIDRDPFELATRRKTIGPQLGNQRSGGAGIRFCAISPDAIPCLCDIQIAGNIIRNTTFCLGSYIKFAHLGRPYGAGTGVEELPLLDSARNNPFIGVLCHKNIMLAGARATVHAGSVWIHAVERNASWISRHTLNNTIAVDPKNAHGTIRLIAGCDDVGRLPAEHEIVAEIDVIEATGGYVLQLCAGKIINNDTTCASITHLVRMRLVNADDSAFVAVGGVDPDGDVVGGIVFRLAIWNWIGLDGRGDDKWVCHIG